MQTLKGEEHGHRYRYWQAVAECRKTVIEKRSFINSRGKPMAKPCADGRLGCLFEVFDDYKGIRVRENSISASAKNGRKNIVICADLSFSLQPKKIKEPVEVVPSMPVVTYDVVPSTSYQSVIMTCKTKFNRKYAYMKHRLSCGRYRVRYQCIDCDETFAYHHGLIRHAQNQHALEGLDHFMLLDVDRSPTERVVYQQLFVSKDFILEEIFETVVERRLEQLVP